MKHTLSPNAVQFEIGEKVVRVLDREDRAPGLVYGVVFRLGAILYEVQWLDEQNIHYGFELVKWEVCNPALSAE